MGCRDGLDEQMSFSQVATNARSRSVSFPSLPVKLHFMSCTGSYQPAHKFIIQCTFPLLLGSVILNEITHDTSASCIAPEQHELLYS